MALQLPELDELDLAFYLTVGQKNTDSADIQKNATEGLKFKVKI